MPYSQFYLKGKQKIPTIFGLLIALVVVIFLSGIFGKNQPVSRASKKIVSRIEVANLNPVQATIFWQSEVPEIGFVTYSKDKNVFKEVALDDRDVAGLKKPFLNHYVTLRNLEADANYFFKLVTGNQVVVKPDGSLFNFKTPISSSANQNLSPANGKIVRSNLLPLENAIALLYIDGYYPLSTLSKSTGEWLIPLNSFYRKDGLEQKVLNSDIEAKMEVLDEQKQISTVTGSLLKFSPVSQTIIIGNNYQLNEESQVLSAMDAMGEKARAEIDITYPVEGGLIPGRIPLIKGVAKPEEKIFITINSKKSYSSIVTSDSKGNWSYLLPERLELGEHKIIIKTNNKNGKEVTIERNFVIVANEGMDAKVLGDATATAEITSTPMPPSAFYPTAIPQTFPTSPTQPVTGLFDNKPVLGGITLIILGLGFFLVF
ncbi:MAG: hypothetical protein UR68_C0001G0016 [Candidatus Roizmanbacteria bacterium GW2011_GWA2_35_19]|uniref:Bacterial Ig-like domain-containing protein n=2 Tax=Candidatus Roizmaniibacteriota TaxID=1752723 RepID=A0A0G0CEA7_9BACT|nr:MAG: hypothetical protein UR63_C0001G0016 [Candidatus Roizmanbacteria bacterium GW2011_GWC2_35_12]KKP74416.1 MAG: hypothetical protein UR68_C0001G0016 [Candidatus Roizmanbacteria bacterium GW2011_GWA2_35_19]